MIEVLFQLDNSKCSTQQFSENPEKYRGLIYCLECKEKAWFIKGFETEKMSRMACFAAHHSNGCNASTVLLVSDDKDSETGSESDSNSSDIYIDLDKSSSQSLFVSSENDKHGEDESEWKSSPSQRSVGNSSDFPLNKSLRQLLSNLCRNPEYLEQDRDVKIVADSGRILIEGKLKDHVVHMTEIKEKHSQHLWIIWGTINNLYSRKSGELWLNYGGRFEPTVIIRKGLDNEILQNFKVKDIEELDGSDILVVASIGFDDKKVLIRPAFTKYMTFRRHKVV